MKAILLLCAAATVATATMTVAQAGKGHFGGGPHSHGTRFGELYKGLTPLERMTTLPGTGQVPPPKHR